MTHTPLIFVGAALSAAILPAAESVAQFGATLIGTGLLTWITIQQSRELSKMREENHRLTQELAQNCKNCTLAVKANALLTDAAEEYMDDAKN